MRSVFVKNNYYKLIVLFMFTAYAWCSMYTKSSCVLVHGTWAQDETWYRPGGDFFESIKSCNQELRLVDEVISFSWSGKLGYPAQLQAAQDLAQLIHAYDFTILIAHSHGATVGMMASQIIFANSTNRNNFGKIKKFYALGVPVNESVVTPAMMVIEKLYNLFSFGDLVQTVNGTCQRVFSEHDRIANISIRFCDLHPSHVQLHHPAFGMYLLKIDRFFAEKNIGSFQNFSFCVPGSISFFSYQAPRYEIEYDQIKLLNEDEQRHRLMTLAFFRGGRSNDKLD